MQGFKGILILCSLFNKFFGCPHFFFFYFVSDVLSFCLCIIFNAKFLCLMISQQCVDLSKDWTSFIGTATSKASQYKGQDIAPSSSNLNSVFILLEASPPKKDPQGRLNLRKVARERVVKLSGLTTPLAWKSGEPFGILVKASANNFGLVGSAYLEGVLELDDGLLVEQIVCKLC